MATTPLSSAAPTGRVRVLLATLAVVLGALAVAFAAKARVPTAEATSIELADLPARLADTGLYEDLATGRIAAGVRPFTPQYPLWTDGARKERWISLPPGASIDATDPDAWVFPVGTKLWKEFAFERPIETRYLERLADGTWRFATYLWSADGSEASLAPEAGVPRAHESRRGVPYDVPGRSACLVCHGGRATPVLGFSALQLSPDRDPLAPHAEVATADDENLSTLSRDGRLRGLPADLLERAPRIEAPTARGRAALGYLHANCGTCHTDGSRIAGLDLRLDARLATGRGVPEALSTTLNRESRWRPPGQQGVASLRVVPGDAKHSVLFRRAASRNPLLQMPPLGTNLVDAEGVALLEAWIREDLAPTTAPESLPPISSSLETVR
ncbi:MAG TPA: hypothetical protein VND21_03805 [Planctomycetota bacterium]|nr:hypothetical protein [Planctomycetota bacterium]